MKLNLTNKTLISKRTLGEDGFLNIPATIARSGIYEYNVSEILEGMGNNIPAVLKNKKPSDNFKVLYPDDLLFKNNLKTDYTPVTDEHPSEFITPENVTKYQKGFVKNGVIRENNNLVGEVLIQDQKLINQIQAKTKEELSTGVSGTVDFKAGVDTLHGSFDAKYTSLNINHIAVVAKGRAGSSVRLSNKNKEVKNMKTIKIGGVDYSFEDQNAQVVENLIAINSEMVETVKTSNESVKLLKKEVDKSTGQIKALQADLVNTEKLEVLADERAELINTVKAIDESIETSGVSNDEIKRSFVAKNSKVEVAEEDSVDVINGIFKHMVATNSVKAPAKKKTDDTFLKNKEEDESTLVKSRNAYRQKCADLNKKVVL